jgi:hypothetical protein
MIKLKNILIESDDVNSQKYDLLQTFPGMYYVISNYGYGDGSCSNALNSVEALELSLQQDPLEENPPSWRKSLTLVDEFKSRLLPRYSTGSKPTHYISDTPESFDSPGDV